MVLNFLSDPSPSTGNSPVEPQFESHHGSLVCACSFSNIQISRVRSSSSLSQFTLRLKSKCAYQGPKRKHTISSFGSDELTVSKCDSDCRLQESCGWALNDDDHWSRGPRGGYCSLVSFSTVVTVNGEEPPALRITCYDLIYVLDLSRGVRTVLVCIQQSLLW